MNKIPELGPGQYEALTVRYRRHVRVLLTLVEMGEAFDPKNDPPPNKPLQLQALWDTGATNTAITKKTAVALGLTPIGIVECHGADGPFEANTYLVSIALPNGVCIPELRVHDASFAGADVLLGMDIIGMGDLGVSNLRGKTALTFRLPSMECLDFVRDKPKHRSEPEPKRNDPCPCGSGKKYKACCGR